MNEWQQAEEKEIEEENDQEGRQGRKSKVDSSAVSILDTIRSFGLNFTSFPSSKQQLVEKTFSFPE